MTDKAKAPESDYRQHVSQWLRQDTQSLRNALSALGVQPGGVELNRLDAEKLANHLELAVEYIEELEKHRDSLRTLNQSLRRQNAQDNETIEELKGRVIDFDPNSIGNVTGY